MVTLYKNPILSGCYPDPSLCRVSDDFYLVNSSFEYFPGVPIFHSRDLVHWRQLGHVLTRKSQLDLKYAPSSCGIYAPTLRYANERFYLVTTNVGRIGNFFVTAKRPEGPWSDPIPIDQEGIDPSLCFDGDTVYYTRNGKGRDFDHPVIKQAKIDITTGKLAFTPRTIWKGTGGVWPEAPHLVKVGNWFYLITAEGGTSYDHSIVVARSKKPFGPFEGCPHNPVLTHRDRPRSQIHAVGHVDLVELKDGTWWAVMLGIRPKHGRFHHLGREIFLAPVTFTKDGWPRIGHKGTVPISHPSPALEPHRFTELPARDDFNAKTLRLDWQFIRNPQSRDWSLTARPGFLRLMGSASTLDDVKSQSAIVRRQQHFDVRCQAKLDFEPQRDNEEAGLFVRAREGFHYAWALRHANGGRIAELISTLNGKRTIVGATKVVEGPVVLEVKANSRNYTFSIVAHGRPRTVGSLPTRSLSSESISKLGPMHFTGAMIGLYATGRGQRSRTPADFDWFEYAVASF